MARVNEIANTTDYDDAAHTTLHDHLVFAVTHTCVGSKLIRVSYDSALIFMAK